MPFQVNGRYFDGLMYDPTTDIQGFTTELTDVRAGSFGRWMYCDDCDKNVLPTALHENVPPFGPTVMALCSECGRGLTPPEPVSRRGGRSS